MFMEKRGREEDRRLGIVDEEEDKMTGRLCC
jgi:hypothetical protein